MKAVVALVGAFSVITNLRMELFEALVSSFSPPPTSLLSSAFPRRGRPAAAGSPAEQGAAEAAGEEILPSGLSYPGTIISLLLFSTPLNLIQWQFYQNGKWSLVPKCIQRIF